MKAAIDKTEMIDNDEIGLIQTIGFLAKDIGIFALKWFLVINFVELILSFIIIPYAASDNGTWAGLNTFIYAIPFLIIACVILLGLLLYCKPLSYIGICSKKDYEEFSFKQKACLKVLHVIIALITTYFVITYGDYLILSSYLSSDACLVADAISISISILTVIITTIALFFNSQK